MLTTLALGTVILVLDAASLLAGLAPLPAWLHWYWLRTDDGHTTGLFNTGLELSRAASTILDLLTTFLLQMLAMMLFSLGSCLHFQRRKYTASNWPITLFRLAILLVTTRAIFSVVVAHKFHFQLLQELARSSLSDQEDENDVSPWDQPFGDQLRWVLHLYHNGRLGAPPAILIVTFLLNTILLVIMRQMLQKNRAWRRLNVAKLF